MVRINSPVEYSNKIVAPNLFWSKYLILVFLIGFITFSPALKNQFLNWDDDHLLYENTDVLKPNLVNIFTDLPLKTYVPLTVLSFALEHKIVGLKPTLYYLDNILLHLIVTYLVFVLARLMGVSGMGSLIAALLFCVHPVHKESVYWITERKDTLCGTFYMATLVFWVRWHQVFKPKFYWLAFICACLAILAKPMALSLPLVMILTKKYIDNNRTSSFQTTLEIMPFFSVVVPIAAITYLEHARIAFLHDRSFMTWIWSFSYYIQKFFIPGEMIPFLAAPQRLSAYIIPGVIFVSVLGSLFLLRFFQKPQYVFYLETGYRKSPVYTNETFKLWTFTVWFYILSIFFLLRFDSFDLDTVAGRFMYLPSVGFCIFCGKYLDKLKKYDDILIRNFRYVLLFMVMATLCIMTYKGNIWKNNLTFWNYVIEKNPQRSIGWDNRGKYYDSIDEDDKAIADYNESIERGEDVKGTYVRRGRLYLKQKKYDLALSDIEMFVNYWKSKNYPKYGLYLDALDTRGYIYLLLGQYEDAIIDLTTVIDNDYKSKSLEVTFSNRGYALWNLGIKDLAWEDFRQALKINSIYKPALEGIKLLR